MKRIKLILVADIFGLVSIGHIVIGVAIFASFLCKKIDFGQLIEIGNVLAIVVVAYVFLYVIFQSKPIALPKSDEIYFLLIFFGALFFATFVQIFYPGILSFSGLYKIIIAMQILLVVYLLVRLVGFD